MQTSGAHSEPRPAVTISALRIRPPTPRLPCAGLPHPAELCPAQGPWPPTPTSDWAHLEEKLGSRQWDQAGAFESAVFFPAGASWGGDSKKRPHGHLS